MAYKESIESSFVEVENVKQLYPTGALKRNSAVGLKATASSATAMSEMGIISASGSASAYVRFWIEVYKVKQFTDGSIAYIDSQGNYVSETGVFLDETGSQIADTTNITKGEVIDYSEYFELGNLTGNYFSASENVVRQVKTVNDVNYVSYFYNSAINSDDIIGLQINAIKMKSTTPSEVLDSNIIIYITMEGVQSSNNAYKTVFDDNHGYYNWES